MGGEQTLRLTLPIPPELDGERADRAVATLLEVSRSEARLLFEEEGVLIDGIPARPRDRVRKGAVLEARQPSDRDVLEPEEVDFAVVLEEKDFLVIDKPAGVVVHPGSGQARGTLAAGLLHRYPELAGIGQSGRWGVVHRLDKDTSGVMVVARSQTGYEALTDQIRRREVIRVYCCLVDRLFDIPTGTIDAPIGRDPHRPTRRAVVDGGKPARTHYEVVEQFPSRSAALLDVRLETGRTHQIRVHLAAIDHPVIGDRTYASRSTVVAAPRVFLHARRIEFTHPGDDSVVRAEAPLPADLVSVLDELRYGSVT